MLLGSICYSLYSRIWVLGRLLEVIRLLLVVRAFERQVTGSEFGEDYRGEDHAV